MTRHIILLLGCTAAMYLASEWFVNAIEWLGVRLNMGSRAVGTILAAVGTAFPESIVTLVAILFGTKAQGADIGVGAALGGPLVVGTLAYGATGVMLILRRRKSLKATGFATFHASNEAAPAYPLDGTDTKLLAKDQVWFLSIFFFKIAIGLVAFAYKPWLGLVFFAAYAVYFRREIRGGTVQASSQDLGPLKIQPKRSSPSTFAVVAQTILTLAIIFASSQLFVLQLEWAGPALGLSPVVVSLLLSPIATELPEVMNAIIWVRQGKTQLALANISGAMMIQATIPSGIGILLTSWMFDTPLILAGVATMASVLYLLLLVHGNRVTPQRLAAAGGFYALFIIGLVLTA